MYTSPYRHFGKTVIYITSEGLSNCLIYITLQNHSQKECLHFGLLIKYETFDWIALAKHDTANVVKTMRKTLFLNTNPSGDVIKAVRLSFLKKDHIGHLLSNLYCVLP